MTKLRWLRIVLLVLLVIVCGFLAFKFFYPTGPEQDLNAATASYKEGSEALAAKDAETAELKFDETVLLTSRALDALEAKIKADPNAKDVPELKKLQGSAYWIKGLAIRDLAYARQNNKGKPLLNITDSVTGKQYRNFLFIPDAKERGEAVACLRLAAFLLPDEVDVQKMALKIEQQIRPMSWIQVHRVAQSAAKLDPKFFRAQYMLCRYDFEQPRTVGSKRGLPLPSEKRSRKRVQDALKRMEKIKELENYPLWRTLHLEVRIHQWLQAYYAENLETAKAEREARIVKGLLLKNDDSAISLAKDGEGFQNMSSVDVKGVLDLHLQALRVAIEEVRDGANSAVIIPVLKATLDQCEEGPEKSYAFRPNLVASNGVAAIALTQPFLALEFPAEWNAQRERAEKLVLLAVEKKQGSPKLFGELSSLIYKHASLLAKQGKIEEAKDLRNQAIAWMAKGIEVGKEQGKSDTELSQLHGLTAQMKLISGSDRNSLKEHLEALKKSQDPSAKTYYYLLQGSLDEQDGKLEKARDNLLAALATENTNQLQIHSVLANIYLALGQSQKALESLHLVNQVYEKFESLSEVEKNWFKLFMRSRDDVYSSLVVAHLGAAEDRIREFVRRNPEKKVPEKLIEFHEKEAHRYLDKLNNSPADRRARQAYCQYLMLTNRPELAKFQVEMLQEEYPGNLAGLLLEQRLLLRSKKGKIDDATKKIIDNRIKDFIGKNKANTGARLLWAQWLLQTDRGKQALEYLNNPVNFPGGKDNQFYTVLAKALFKEGDRDELLRIQKQHRNPAIDLALLMLTEDPEIIQKQLDKARARYDRKGVFLCWDATLNLNANRYEEAARGFANALDYTRVKPWGRFGLQRSLIQLARTDPKKARELIQDFLKEHSNEPVLYLTYAYASLRLDDIGRPRDTWPTVKNMASALNYWEKLTRKGAPQSANGPLAQADFWALANDPIQARLHTLRALKLEPENPVALRKAVNFCLVNPTPEKFQEAETYLKKLEELKPKDEGTYFSKANFYDKKGQAQKAISTYEQLLKEHPEATRGYVKLLALLRDQKDWDQFAVWVDTFRKKFPENSLPVRLKVAVLARQSKVQEADKLISDFIAERVKESQQVLEKRKAPKGLNAEDFAKQKQMILSRFRKNLHLELLKGFIQAEAWDEAETRLKNVLDEDPDYLLTKIVLGDMYIRNHSWNEAREIYNSVLDKQPNNVIAGNNLAWLLATKFSEDPQALQKAYQIGKSLRISTTSKKKLPGDRLRIELLDTLGNIYTKLGRADLYKEMKELFEEGRQRYPQDPRIYLYLGHACAGLGEPKQAEQFFTVAINLAEDSPILKQEERTNVIQQAKKGKERIGQP